ncbi:sensor histidine kinase [Paenibacillus agri]|uniref:histidine kinase n=1 Tax=Paenibacillus agri TaxID=2744309 RepID=A0A850EHB9_9BACL|nr:HAMP domain-containing sensor histidine kinase [Paenibacillus agri]NUU60515.1 HAMP domain-containing histidine kinase [Paenibacillus agri]
MKKNGVVLKLFVVTSVMILIVFSIAMLVEGLFFERFYRTTKISKLEQNVQEFGRQYTAVHSGGDQAAHLLGDFMNQHDVSIAIFNHQFERISVEPYYIRIASPAKSITIRISSDGTMLNDIPAGLHTGDHLVVDGLYMDEKDTIMQPAKLQPSGAQPEEGLSRVTGTITDLLLPEDRSFNPYYQDTLIQNALGDWINKMDTDRVRLTKGLPVQMEWTDKWSGIVYAVVVLSLPEAGEGGRYVFAMTSLQPVGEAVSILTQYFLYLAPVILILVTLLSLIYSRIVSFPLVKLSKAATRMAELDFSQQPSITSKDEFGDLSRSMNTLSQNLDATLKQLTEANQDLQEEVAKKERSEQLRKELIANISHELKTPLGIVKGFAEGLQDDVAIDKRERYLHLIVNETDRMNALIMDMLELSKFEAKAIRLHPKEIYLGRLVRNVASSFDHQLVSKNLHIDILETEEWAVQADPRRLEQVVLNLLSNAVRYAEEHSTIRIEIQQASPGIIMTRIDNVGPSIPEDDMERIWDQFYRAERSRDRKFGGTGLGLAIVKNILDLHGSRCGAENTKQGVSFYFTLEQVEPMIITEES